MSGLETETDRGRRNSYVRGCASVKRMRVPATFGIYNPSRSLGVHIPSRRVLTPSMKAEKLAASGVNCC